MVYSMMRPGGRPLGPLRIDDFDFRATDALGRHPSVGTTLAYLLAHTPYPYIIFNVISDRTVQIYTSSECHRASDKEK
jgi:hypothetical protein